MESFNGKLRDELLHGEIFYTLREAKVLIEQWRRHYNTVRPHSALGYRPPAPEALAPPAGPNRPQPQHFAAFIEQMWKCAKEDGLRQQEDFPECWRPAWTTLLDSSGIPHDGFSSFVAACELEFCVGLPQPLGASPRDRNAALQDVEKLSQVLLDAAASPKRISPFLILGGNSMFQSAPARGGRCLSTQCDAPQLRFQSAPARGGR